MRRGLLVCLLCSSTTVAGKAGICFYCQLVFPTATANYAIRTLLVFLYEAELRKDYFCIKLVVTSNVEAFLNVNGIRCNLFKNNRSSEWDNE